jgi:glutamate-1-semialdehyde 2,1-aminomutase
MQATVDGPVGQQLWQRADQVLPGGLVYMSRSARFAGEGVLPGFIRSAQGCRITDVDGREYIDFICGNGPNLLGYCNPEVDEAARQQAEKADLTSFYPESIVEFAERLLEWGQSFQWVVHVKNGSDALTLATRVMRIHTGRPLVILFERAYHGFGSELSLAHELVPGDALQHILRLPWNDSEALRNAALKHGDQIAGIVMNPLEQSPARQTQSATPAFIEAIKTFRRETGSLLVVDDVRHGFRLNPRGSHHELGLDPDLLCLGKALANGYATSALLGTEALRAASRKIQFTATYMFSPVAYQAGIKTLEIYARDNVFEHMQSMATLLVNGITEAARDTGHAVVLSGPATMPTLLFEGERKGERARHFAREAALRGAIFHPALNWFISGAHKIEDIEEAIEIARQAFGATPLT